MGATDHNHGHDFLSGLVWAAFATCVALGVNVGANNSAAEMGPAYGAGVHSRREAVAIIAVFSFLGAVLAGHTVMQTLGSGLVGDALFARHVGAVTLVLFSALVVVATANVLKIPVATSHALVGSIVGFGMYYGTVVWTALITVLVWWLLTPALSLALAYLAGRHLYPGLRARLQNRAQWYRLGLTVSGCLMAFSAGSNSLAKAVGPLVAAGLLSSNQAGLLGGLSMAAGAVLMGWRLLDSVGKNITPLDGLSAILIQTMCACVVLVASGCGVPVSLAEIVTCSVIGFAASQSSLASTVSNPHVQRIYRFWPVCPLLTAGLSYLLAAALTQG